MQLRMNLVDRSDGSSTTVDLRAAAHHTLDDLLAAHGRTDTTVHVGGRRVPPDAPIGRPPLLDAATLVLGSDDAEEDTLPRRAPLRVVTTCGPDAGRTHELQPGRHTIGRGEAATLRVADDALSREHLELTVDRDGVLLRDLGTTNGTTVDGAAVPAAGTRVRAGSHLRAGRSTFVIEAHRPRPSRRTVTGDGTDSGAGGGAGFQRHAPPSTKARNEATASPRAMPPPP